MSTPETAARELLDVAPSILRAIRAEMRAHRLDELSVPQFRTLGYLNRSPGASLSDVAEHIGLTLPTMSKLVDGLVTRRLATRATHAADRRRVTLALTPAGAATWRSARESAQDHLAKLLAALPADERETIVRAMQILRPIFVPEQAGK